MIILMLTLVCLATGAAAVFLYLTQTQTVEATPGARKRQPASSPHSVSNHQTGGQNADAITNAGPVYNAPVTINQMLAEGIGGKGGSANVGGNGLAIGGSGGHAGKYGRGGDGGGGSVKGDGIVGGGDGGSSDSDTLWPAPAKSGYETYQEASGQPIDPKMRQYGRGGMSPGYASRFQIVEKIRAEYFKANHEAPQNALENVNAVPLDYVNEKLAAMGVNWRARIVRGLDYEFFVPEPASIAPITNSMGDVSNNKGIVTQGQQGNNTEPKQ